MRGRVESGSLCTVVPVSDPGEIVPGEVVLCTVRGKDYLHLVKARQENRFQIGNNVGGINGWIGAGAVHGRLTSTCR
jgi:hypothetical protein